VLVFWKYSSVIGTATPARRAICPDTGFASWLTQLVTISSSFTQSRTPSSAVTVKVCISDSRGTRPPVQRTENVVAATPAAGADVPHEKFTAGSMRVSVGTVRSTASKYWPVSPSPASSRRHSSGSKPGRIAGDRRGDLRRRASGNGMVDADLAVTGPAWEIGADRPPRCPNPLRTP
jgi:hypothetical protein